MTTHTPMTDSPPLTRIEPVKTHRDPRGWLFEPLTDAEEQSILTTMLKQRRESVEQFTKGNRPELAAKEEAEIVLIDAYMPKAASEDDIRAIVTGAVEQITADNGGTKPGPKDMGAVMKVAQARIQASGIRADGKMVSEMVKAELAKG